MPEHEPDGDEATFGVALGVEAVDGDVLLDVLLLEEETSVLVDGRHVGSHQHPGRTALRDLALVRVHGKEQAIVDHPIPAATKKTKLVRVMSLCAVALM